MPVKRVDLENDHIYEGIPLQNADDGEPLLQVGIKNAWSVPNAPSEQLEVELLFGTIGKNLFKYYKYVNGKLTEASSSYTWTQLRGCQPEETLVSDYLYFGKAERGYVSPNRNNSLATRHFGANILVKEYNKFEVQHFRFKDDTIEEVKDDVQSSKAE